MAGEGGMIPNADGPGAPERRASERFRKHNPPTFNGMGDPMDAEKWIRCLERIFDFMGLTDKERLTCAIFQLTDEADYWWESVQRTLSPQQWEEYTWENFKAELYEKYIPQSYRIKKEAEFWNLRQGNKSVTEYDRLFVQLSRYAPHLVDTEEKRSEKFRRGLRHEIGMPLASQGTLTYAQSLSRARDIEAMMPEEMKTRIQDNKRVDNNNKRKRKWQGTDQQMLQNQQEERNTQQQVPFCQNCHRNHFGVCKAGSDVCYKCGDNGHFARQCPGTPHRPQQHIQNQGRKRGQRPIQIARAYALDRQQQAQAPEDVEGTTI
ncbi:uncharacterized protein LOC130994199 [Salvia miltiorrhiza]|uniref:uncharacterized protein LOC130994198 n=1 Tax=Salvia miltiorrhiza TaxID=226208 RepID=UPI0025ABE48E|nr:uncharacterized protein LOC130994198 [Salvia miltiorrhiza]XP_057775216.1 uncharacterized protein LOC130994199 [Salvia miltiorrhiza]